MSDTKNRQRKGTSLLIEGIVILASILVAFGLEGWRADRELERDLTQELESVYRELERNRDLVVAELLFLDRLMYSAEDIIVMLESSPGSAYIAVPDTTAILGTTWSPTVDPSLGAVQALIGSGRLAQVPDPLRQGLAGLGDRFIDAREEQLLARAVFSNDIFPLTQESLDYRAFGRLMAKLLEPGDAGTFSQEGMSDQSLPSLGMVDYPNSPAIRNALELRRQWYMTVQDELAQLLVFLNELIEDMEAELANR